jgi:hypothetical protein
MRLAVTINPGVNNAVLCTSPTLGTYDLFVAFDSKVLPDEGRRNFLNWQQPVKQRWDASLRVSCGETTLQSSDNLELVAAIESDDLLYFQIGKFEVVEKTAIAISIAPDGPAPFAAQSAQLVVRPETAFGESKLFPHLLRRAVDIVCPLIAVALLIDYLRIGILRNNLPNKHQPETGIPHKGV